jgi:hypothetical protein
MSFSTSLLLMGLVVRRLRSTPDQWTNRRTRP